MTDAPLGDRKEPSANPRARTAPRRVARGHRTPRDVATEETERRLGRIVGVVTPLATLGAATVVGVIWSLGQGILVLAAGALFGTVAFFWASLRTLGGQAPLADGFDRLALRRVESPDGPAERKRAALRALKDLAFEHEIGKLDEEDYTELSARYREEAKAVMRQIDTAEAPQRERAEAMVRAYIAKRGVEGRARPPRGRDGSPERILPGNRVRRDSTSSGPEAGVLCTHCPARNPLDADYCKGCGIFIRSTECTHCSTANDPDAAFCKRCGTVLTAPATPGSKPNAAR